MPVVYLVELQRTFGVPPTVVFVGSTLDKARQYLKILNPPDTSIALVWQSDVDNPQDVDGPCWIWENSVLRLET